MKKIEEIHNIDDIDTWGDLVWLHFRGWLFIILTFIAILCTLNMSIHYSVETDFSKLENIRYCTVCGADLLDKR